MGEGFANVDSGTTDGGRHTTEHTQRCNKDPATGVPLDAVSFYRELDICERLFDEGNPKGARLKLMLLEGLKPTTEDQWKRMYSLSLKLGDRTRAQLATEGFLEVCRDNATVHLAYAKSLISMYDNWDRVRAALAAALKNPVHTSEFWRDSAEIQSAIDDHEGARESARKSLKLDPTNLDLREILITSLCFLGRTREALVECKIVAHGLANTEVQEPLRWARLARIAAEGGALKASKAYIERSVVCLTEVSRITDFELVRALLLTKQAARARPHFESLLQENTPNSWLWTTLLRTAMQTGDYEFALEAIARLKALPYPDPEFIIRLNAIEAKALKRRDSKLTKFIRRWL
jgi:predicted Zn-dependent protease